MPGAVKTRDFDFGSIPLSKAVTNRYHGTTSKLPAAFGHECVFLRRIDPNSNLNLINIYKNPLLIHWFFEITSFIFLKGMGMIAATLLLFCEEEDVFWMMISIIEDVLPSAYYSSSLWGAQTDQQVLTSLLATHLPLTYTILTNHSIDLSLITM